MIFSFNLLVKEKKKCLGSTYTSFKNQSTIGFKKIKSNDPSSPPTP